MFLQKQIQPVETVQSAAMRTATHSICFKTLMMPSYFRTNFIWISFVAPPIWVSKAIYRQRVKRRKLPANNRLCTRVSITAAEIREWMVVTVVIFVENWTRHIWEKIIGSLDTRPIILFLCPIGVNGNSFKVDAFVVRELAGSTIPACSARICSMILLG